MKTDMKLRALRVGPGLVIAVALLGAPACSSENDGASSTAEEVDSGYLTGLSAIDEQNSSNAHVLLDGTMGATAPQWTTSNVYSASSFPMRAVIDLGQTYDVSDIELFHGNGAGMIEVKYLPVGGSVSSDAAYTLIENHTPSLWNAYETVKIVMKPRARYLELVMSSPALYANYSELRVKGTAVGGTTTPPSPDAGTTTPPVGSTCTSTIGTGSGSFTLTSTNAPSGAIVCIKGGTYTGATMTGLKNVKVLLSGPVTFTGSVALHGNDGLTIDGSLLSGKTYGITFGGGGTAFDPGSGASAHNQNVVIRGVEFDDVIAVNADSQRIQYNGSAASTLFTNLTLDKIKTTGGTTIYNGPYGFCSDYWNVTNGLNLTNVVVVNDPNAGPVRVRGASIYKVVADHWNVTGNTLGDGQGDVGIFYFQGNGTFSNWYRNGGYGYIARISNVSLGTPSASYFENIVDVNTTEYGTVDTRIDPAVMQGTAALPLVGNDVHIFNVTSGNKKTIRYRSPLAIIGSSRDSTKVYTVEVKNCFAFDNAQSQDNGGSLLRNYNPGDTNLVASNNLAVEGPLPAGYLVDQTTFHPTPGGPLVGKGVVIPQTETDLYGVGRGSAFDLGAVQHQ